MASFGEPGAGVGGDDYDGGVVQQPVEHAVRGDVLGWEPVPPARTASVRATPTVAAMIPATLFWGEFLDQFEEGAAYVKRDKPEVRAALDHLANQHVLRGGCVAQLPAGRRHGRDRTGRDRQPGTGTGAQGGWA